jgi:hypothetical protein
MTISKKIRSDVLSRDGNQCRRCYARRDLELHHLVPVSRGGSNIETNLITLCVGCHNYVEKNYALSNMTILNVLTQIICDKHIGPINNESKKSNYRLIAVSVKIYDRLKMVKGKQSFGVTIEHLLNSYEAKKSKIYFT